MEKLTTGYVTADYTIADAVDRSTSDLSSSVEHSTAGTRWSSGGGGDAPSVGGSGISGARVQQTLK